MRLHTSVAGIFSLDSTNPDVMNAQIKAFSKLAPSLYVIGNINAAALAWTHLDVAPRWLTLYLPVVMVTACFLRVLVWARVRYVTLSPERARRRLAMTIFMTSVMGGCYAGWALALYPYGSVAAKCHIAFFMSTTLIGTLFCLMHIRPAARMLTAVVAIPFLLRFATSGEPILAAIAINFLLVILVMIHIVGIYCRDFTQKVLAERALARANDENFRLANLDSLTGLPNRRSFFTDLQGLFAEKEGSIVPFAVGSIDLDGFKPVNDVHGHMAGDRVLVEIGRRLRDVLGEDAAVARLGGDEFAFVLPGPIGPTEVARWGTALCDAVAVPIQVQNGTVRVTASIGFVLRDRAELTRDRVLEQVDYALYEAKSSRRGAAVLFSEQHEQARHGASIVERALRDADFQAEMRLLFQPIVAVGPDRIIAYEALARWTSPKLGDVSPTSFITAAERTNQICDLTEVLLDKALEAMTTWPSDIDLSFNLSAHDLASSTLLQRVEAATRGHGISLTRVTFEITETALMRDFEQSLHVLRALRTLGATIALDDFGTGYSSLSYVHRLPLDKIKIDRSFITNVTVNATSRNIVRSIVDLCQNLGIVCVVEGIETPEQLLIVQSLGCRTMQGYLFGKPGAPPKLSYDQCGSRMTASPTIPRTTPTVTELVA